MTHIYMLPIARPVSTPLFKLFLFFIHLFFILYFFFFLIHFPNSVNSPTAQVRLTQLVGSSVRVVLSHGEVFPELSPLVEDQRIAALGAGLDRIVGTIEWLCEWRRERIAFFC